jgi:hypothetical protein
MEHRSIANPKSSAGTGSVQQRLVFLLSKVLNKGNGLLVRGYRKDAVNQIQCRGHPMLQESHEALDGAQSSIPARRPILPLAAKMSEEGEDEGCVQLLQLKARWRNPKLPARIFQHEPKSVRIRVASPRTGAPLDRQAVVQKRREMRRQERHRPAFSTTARAASAISFIRCGVASKYQYV